MVTLQDKIQNTLDETRILILGSQVLHGFQLRSFFTPGFHGEDTARFHRSATRFVMAALVPLGLGACAEVYLVTVKTLSSPLVAGLTAALSAAAMLGLWWLNPMSQRRRSPEVPLPPPAPTR